MDELVQWATTQSAVQRHDDDPGGEPTSAVDRLAEIQERYGPGHLVTRFIVAAGPELLAAVERTERRLAAAS